MRCCVMIDLAEPRSDGRTPLRKIAARQGISEKYLENILTTLVRHGLLSGLRGKGGGYCLTREPEDFTIGEVLRLTEARCARLPVWSTAMTAATARNTVGPSVCGASSIP